MKAEWFQKLRKDGEADIEFTSEMGKPSFKSNKQYIADTEAKYKREKENKAMNESHAAKEEVFLNMQRMEYERRESGMAKTVVPQPKNFYSNEINFHPGQKKSGAVLGTSSEDDIVEEGVEVRDLNQVRWTPRLEVTLEEMLIRNQFDFKATSKEFQRVLNRDEGTNTVMFKIDYKTLKIRCIDIEIRRHVMPQMQQSHFEEDGKAAEAQQVDDDFPPLKEPERSTSSKLIKYDSKSNSEDENQVKNDLEELD